jgi:ParB-like chromosome segregation protein Spo0J
MTDDANSAPQNGTIFVAIEKVTVVGDRRPINEATVAQLMESYKSSGRFLNPITLRKAEDGGDSLPLVTGWHRYVAANRLGIATIECTVIEVDDALRIELMEIDENIVRHNPSPAEHARLTVRRGVILKELAERDGTQFASKQARRRAGQMTGPDDASTRDQAERTGESKDKIHRSKKRGGIIGDLIDKVIGTSLDKGVELDALTTLPKAEREALVNRAASGEEVSARTENRKATTKRARKVKLTRREEAFAEIHSWHIKYDDLEELRQVKRQIMEIEDALSKTDVRSEEGVSPPSSVPSNGEKEEGDV